MASFRSTPSQSAFTAIVTRSPYLKQAQPTFNDGTTQQSHSSSAQLTKEEMDDVAIFSYLLQSQQVYLGPGLGPVDQQQPQNKPHLHSKESIGEDRSCLFGGGDSTLIKSDYVGKSVESSGNNQAAFSGTMSHVSSSSFLEDNSVAVAPTPCYHQPYHAHSAAPSSFPSQSGFADFDGLDQEYGEVLSISSSAVTVANPAVDQPQDHYHQHQHLGIAPGRLSHNDHDHAAASVPLPLLPQTSLQHHIPHNMHHNHSTTQMPQPMQPVWPAVPPHDDHNNQNQYMRVQQPHQWFQPPPMTMTSFFMSSSPAAAPMNGGTGGFAPVPGSGITAAMPYGGGDNGNGSQLYISISNNPGCGGASGYQNGLGGVAGGGGNYQPNGNNGGAPAGYQQQQYQPEFSYPCFAFPAFTQHNQPPHLPTNPKHLNYPHENPNPNYALLYPEVSYGYHGGNNDGVPVENPPPHPHIHMDAGSGSGAGAGAETAGFRPGPGSGPPAPPMVSTLVTHEIPTQRRYKDIKNKPSVAVSPDVFQAVDNSIKSTMVRYSEAKAVRVQQHQQHQRERKEAKKRHKKEKNDKKLPPITANNLSPRGDAVDSYHGFAPYRSDRDSSSSSGHMYGRAYGTSSSSSASSTKSSGDEEASTTNHTYHRPARVQSLAFSQLASRLSGKSNSSTSPRCNLLRLPASLKHKPSSVTDNAAAAAAAEEEEYQESLSTCSSSSTESATIHTTRKRQRVQLQQQESAVVVEDGDDDEEIEGGGDENGLISHQGDHEHQQRHQQQQGERLITDDQETNVKIPLTVAELREEEELQLQQQLSSRSSAGRATTAGGGGGRPSTRKSDHDDCSSSGEVSPPSKNYGRNNSGNDNNLDNEETLEITEIAKFPVKFFNSYNNGDDAFLFRVIDEYCELNCTVHSTTVPDRVCTGREYIKKLFASFLQSHPDMVILLRDAHLIHTNDGKRLIDVKTYWSGTRTNTTPSFSDELFRRPGENVAQSMLDPSKMSPEDQQRAYALGEENKTHGAMYRGFGKWGFTFQLDERNKIVDFLCDVTMTSLKVVNPSDVVVNQEASSSS